MIQAMTEEEVINNMKNGEMEFVSLFKRIVTFDGELNDGTLVTAQTHLDDPAKDDVQRTEPVEGIIMTAFRIMVGDEVIKDEDPV